MFHNECLICGDLRSKSHAAALTVARAISVLADVALRSDTIAYHAAREASNNARLDAGIAELQLQKHKQSHAIVRSASA